MNTPLIVVKDKMQRGYKYTLTEPMGKNFDPEFQPELTPKQMLEYGVFEGKYMTDCKKEFPENRFKKAKLSPEKPNPSLNCFRIKSHQSLRTWHEKGWILPEDPDIRGWFQWYCRYYSRVTIKWHKKWRLVCYMARHQKRRITALFKAFDNKAIWQTAVL